MDWTPILTALEKRGFRARAFATAGEAKTYLLEALAGCPNVGIGGSVTVRDIALSASLRERGHTVHWHWEAEPEARARALRLALDADAYLCSANALLQDGRIVQIDGTGNRLAALCYGPPKVFLVVGQNKLVDGGLPAGIARIKSKACPPNARRLNLETPCARTGACNEEACGRVTCRLTLALEAPPNGREVEVLLVSEDLGY